jgi:hypothetical protein
MRAEQENPASCLTPSHVSRHAYLLIAAALMIPMSGTLVHAQPSSDPAKVKAAADAFDEGGKLFKAKDYEGAAAQFETADRYGPSPAALTNAIKARSKAGHLARASTLSAQALVRYPANADLNKLAKQTISANEKDLVRVDVTCTPACTLLLDQKVASGEPVATYTLYLEPSAHALVAGWTQDRSKSVSITGKKGDTQTLALEAPPEPPPAPKEKKDPVPTSSSSTTVDAPPAPVAKKSGLPPWVFFTGVGISAIVGGVTVWSGLDATNNPGKSKVQTHCSTGLPDCDSLYDKGVSAQNRTNVLIVASAVSVAATGVVGLLFTKWGDSAPAPATQGALNPRVTPAVSFGNGTTVGMLGTFLTSRLDCDHGRTPRVAEEATARPIRAVGRDRLGWHGDRISRSIARSGWVPAIRCDQAIASAPRTRASVRRYVSR